jgi:uncharacterized membrane protein
VCSILAKTIPRSQEAQEDFVDRRPRRIPPPEERIAAFGEGPCSPGPVDLNPGMDLYEALKYIHVLAAAAWVGGTILSQVHGMWVAKKNDPHDFNSFIDFQAYLGTRYFMPLAIVVIAAGIGMVLEAEAWGFGDTWILIGIALYAASVAIGAGFLGPQSEKIKAALASGGPPDTALQAKINTVVLASRIDTVILILVVGDMVIKPGL